MSQNPETIIVVCEECQDRFYVPSEVCEEGMVIECDACGGDCFEDDDQSPVFHQSHMNPGLGYR